MGGRAGWAGTCLAVLLPFLVLAPLSAPRADGVGSDDLCRAWIQHRPDPDVTYQPGMDVHGHAVAPADLPDSWGAAAPLTFRVPLTLDLFKVLNLPATDFPFHAMGRDDINLGDLTISGDQVLLNGKSLNDDQQERLSVLCLQPPGGTHAPTSLSPSPNAP